MRFSASLPIGLCCAFLAAAPVPATAPVPIDWQMVAKIRAEGLQRSKVMDYQGYMTDVLGARLTASQDMRRAQEWALGEMRKLGLENVAAEEFMDYGASWDNEFVSVHMLEPDYSPLVGYPLAHTPGTDGVQTAEAVIVGPLTREEADRWRGRLRGKVALTTPPATIDLRPLVEGVPRRSAEELEALQRTVIAPPRAAPGAGPPPGILPPREQLEFFRSEGVAALFESRSGWLGAVRGFSRPGSRQDGWSAAGDSAAPPVLAITPEHYNRMYRILERGIPVRVQVDVRNRIGAGTARARNLVGEIRGSDLRDEVVMIGAHFDTWHASPNASDNTSGVAVMLEAMRILKAVGATPRRTIRIALWSGEEQGLFGSRAYVREHFGNPNDAAVGKKPAYDRLYAYFNQDYGPGQYLGIYLQGNEGARTLLGGWMEPFQDFGLTVVSNQSVGSTDHIAFDEVGLPGFQFLQDRVPGTGGHTNLDFLDTIQAEDLMKNAVVMASYAWHAAMSDERIPRKAQGGMH